MLDPTSSQRIRRLHREGYGTRTIARTIGVSRNTVRAYLRDDQHGLCSAFGRAFKLDAGDSQKLRELYCTAGGNSMVIQRALTLKPEKYGFAQGFQVSARAIRRFYLARHIDLVRPKEDPTFPFTTEPGAQLQIDFIKAKFCFAGKERSQTVFIFEATYSWSRKTFLRVCPDMTQASWLMAVAQCMAKLGIPRQILCDNDKGLVIHHPRGPDHAAMVRYHPSFLWLCAPLGIHPRACLPQRAKTKGRVERYGRYVQDNALAECAVDREDIPDKEHLQKALDKWIAEVADKRSFEVPGGGSKTVEELYEEEKPLLSFPPKLATTFDITSWTTIADKNSKICLYGADISLTNNSANSLVYVSMRANGETLVMAEDGEILAQVQIPPKNLIEFSRNDKPRPRQSQPIKKDSQQKLLLEEYSKIMS